MDFSYFYGFVDEYAGVIIYIIGAIVFFGIIRGILEMVDIVIKRFRMMK